MISQAFDLAISIVPCVHKHCIAKFQPTRGSDFVARYGSCSLLVFSFLRCYSDLRYESELVITSDELTLSVDPSVNDNLIDSLFSWRRSA